MNLRSFLIVISSVPHNMFYTIKSKIFITLLTQFPHDLFVTCMWCVPQLQSTLHSMNQATYIHDIPSVHGVNPMLPVALTNIDFNIGIAAGDLVDHQHVQDARATA